MVCPQSNANAPSSATTKNGCGVCDVYLLRLEDASQEMYAVASHRTGRHRKDTNESALRSVDEGKSFATITIRNGARQRFQDSCQVNTYTRRRPPGARATQPTRAAALACRPRRPRQEFTLLSSCCLMPWRKLRVADLAAPHQQVVVPGGDGVLRAGQAQVKSRAALAPAECCDVVEREGGLDHGDAPIRLRGCVFRDLPVCAVRRHRHDVADLADARLCLAAQEDALHHLPVQHHSHTGNGVCTEAPPSPKPTSIAKTSASVERSTLVRPTSYPRPRQGPVAGPAIHSRQRRPTAWRL